MPKNHINRLETIDRLIKIKATGTPKQLAKKLEISERTVFRLIDFMRSLGAPVFYCENRRSYCYREEGFFTFYFQKIDGEEIQNSF